jgi:cellulose synthase/poly-beta-1,6-N-acetylglucosamine synthase-like glycosyltransferase
VIEILIGAILVYYVCLHGLYALLIALGATQLRRYQMGVTFGEYRRIAESPLTMPISLVIPAYNEEMVIVNTVLCALKLRYPQHEVIVVNDGSATRRSPRWSSASACAASARWARGTSPPSRCRECSCRRRSRTSSSSTRRTAGAPTRSTPA